jgi:hypothetical protein
MLLAMAVVMAALPGCGGRASQPRSAAPTARPEATLAAPSAANPTPAPSGAEILQRSVDAMRTVTAVYESRLYPRSGGSEDGAVVGFHDGQVRSMWPVYTSLPSCQFRDYDFALARRTGGAYGRIGRGTAPDSIELLGTVDYEGVTAWKIRYRFTSPSIEGPFPVERTEWIDTETFHVLRAEREQVDPFGFIGQVAEVARSFDRPSECPATPALPESVFHPSGPPRLELPGASDTP